MWCIIFVSLPRPLLKVNINAFLCLFLKLSPSNLLFSRFKVIAGRKVTPADFLWIWVSAAAESSSLTAAIQSQALVLHFTSSWMEKGKAGFLLHRWTCLCLHAVCRLAIRYQHINICHFWYRWTVTWKSVLSCNNLHILMLNYWSMSSFHTVIKYL